MSKLLLSISFTDNTTLLSNSKAPASTEALSSLLCPIISKGMASVTSSSLSKSEVSEGNFVASPASVIGLLALLGCKPSSVVNQTPSAPLGFALSKKESAPKAVKPVPVKFSEKLFPPVVLELALFSMSTPLP